MRTYPSESIVVESFLVRGGGRFDCEEGQTPHTALLSHHEECGVQGHFDCALSRDQ